MAGMCEVPIPPTMRRHVQLSRRAQHGAEFFDAAAGLLGADVLHVETEYAGEFRQVVDVAAGVDHRQHVAAPHGVALCVVQAVLAAIRLLVTPECRRGWRRR